jgi:elongation factor G
MSKAATWLIEFKIEPRFAADAERLVHALAQMASENSHFGYSKNTESGELIAKVVDDLHVEEAVDILKHTHKLEVNIGSPQVAYRETLEQPTEIDYTHKMQYGATGQFARVKLRLEPNALGGGNVFERKIVCDVIPEKYIQSVENGVQSVWVSGVLSGFPMVDSRVILFDGGYHEMDSSDVAFEIAARAAMRKGVAKAGVKLLEPIMDVEVVSPSDFISAVIGDLNARRGKIHSQAMRGNITTFQAHAPLATLLGYKNRLSSITNGLGSYRMRFRHYAEIPTGGPPDEFRPDMGMRA